MENSIGKRISEKRRNKGLKQDELAEILGVSPQAVSKWENDISCPDIMLLPSLAKTLDTTTDYLLSGDPIPETVLVPAENRKSIKDMILKIVVNSSDGDKVRVNLPMGLVQIAVDCGMSMAQFSNNDDTLKNLDLKQILQLVEQGVVGNLVEVDSHDGDTVRVYVE